WCRLPDTYLGILRFALFARFLDATSIRGEDARHVHHEDRAPFRAPRRRSRAPRGSAAVVALEPTRTDRAGKNARLGGPARAGRHRARSEPAARPARRVYV